MSDGREAKALLPALRRHPDTLLDALSALRQALVDLAPDWLGSPPLIRALGASRRPMEAAGLRKRRSRASVTLNRWRWLS